MKRTIVLAAAFAFAPVAAQSPAGEQFPPGQIEKGAETFAVFCSPCHGERMSSPEFFNLKTFPPDQRSRFINSVTNGKNAMPPWRGQLNPEDIDRIGAGLSSSAALPRSSGCSHGGSTLSTIRARTRKLSPSTSKA